MRSNFVAFFAFANIVCINIFQVEASNFTAILESTLEGYDRRVRPNYGAGPVEVGLTMYLLSVGPVSEKDTSFTFSAYFRHFWSDPRLSFSGPPELNKIVIGDDEFISSFWKPDTFIVNAKTYREEGNQLFRLSKWGDIIHSRLITVTSYCPMSMKYYPIDVQRCEVGFESYGFTMDDIVYKWYNGDDAVQISSDVSLPQFQIVGHRKKTIEAYVSTGNYSRLALEIWLKRASGYSFIQAFVPASMMVVFSWVSFFCNSKSSSGKLAVGITSVIGMMIILASSQLSRPKVAYLTVDDVYLLGCFLLVTVAFIDSAMTLRFHHCWVKENHSKCIRTMARFLKYLRLVYPLLFTFLNILYWSLLASNADAITEDVILVNN